MNWLLKYGIYTLKLITKSIQPQFFIVIEKVDLKHVKSNFLFNFTLICNFFQVDKCRRIPTLYDIFKQKKIS